MRRWVAIIALVALPSWAQTASQTFTAANSDEVKVDDGGVLDMPAGDMSFGIWFKTSDSGTRRSFIGHLSTDLSTFEAGYYCDLLGTGKLRCFAGVDLAGTGDDCRVFRDTSSTYNDGAWHAVIVTWDASVPTLTIYVDGVSDTTGGGSKASDCPPDVYAISNNVAIGTYSDSDSSSYSNFFEGQLFGAFVVERLLTAAEVQAAYRCSPLEITPNAYWPINDTGWNDYGYEGAGAGTCTNCPDASEDGPPWSDCSGVNP